MFVFVANEICDCFCRHYRNNCSGCPLGKYRISSEYAICYYSVPSNKPTPKQIQQFLHVARGHWNRSWTCKLSDEARKILSIKAKVV